MERHNKVLLFYMISSLCLLTLTSSQPLSDDAGGDWVVDCKLPCSCFWGKGKKTAECRGIQRIPTAISDQVQIIDLNNNQIVKLDNGEFKNRKLVHLHQIGLRKNLLRHVEPLAFDGLKVLTSLDLSENNFDKIELHIFEPLERIKEIKLAHNKNLTRLVGEFPVSLENTLEQLDLFNCSLSYLPDGVFNNLKSLIQLNLGHNKFQFLSVDIFLPLKSLKGLILANNPFDCDCHTRDLHSWCVDKKLALQTTCDYSSQLRRKIRWDQMTKDDFYCLPNVTNFRIFEDKIISSSNEIISTGLGTDITFECHIDGDPLSVVAWYKENDMLFNTTRNIKSDKYDLYSIRLPTNTATNLTIKNVDKDDVGNYECVGANIGGNIRKSAQLLVDTGITGSVGTRVAKNKLWLWILLGLLGFILLLGLIILIICICLRKRNHHSNKTQQVGDIKPSANYPKSFESITEKDSQTTTSVSSPLLEKPNENNITINNTTQNTEKDLYEDLRNRGNLTDGRMMTPLLTGYDSSTLGRAQTPIPGTYISNVGRFGGSQIFSPPPNQPVQLHQGINPYASYDPRRQQSLTLNYRQPQVGTPTYGRLYSPFSGSVASFTSEPAAPRIYPGPAAYVTLPRRKRVPSWSPAQGAGSNYSRVPPSPTGSLPGFVPNLRYNRLHHNIGPRYDGVGPRTDAHGGSTTSLNKLGVGHSTPTATRTPTALHTPITPLTPVSGRVTPSGRVPKPHNILPTTHFNFDTIEEETRNQETIPSTSSLATDSSWKFHPITPSHEENNPGENVALRNPPPAYESNDPNIGSKKLPPPNVPPKPKRVKSAELRDNINLQPENNVESSQQQQESATTTDLFNIQGTEV